MIVRRPLRRGFTLVEALATLVLVGIVVPAVMGAVLSAQRAASLIRSRNVAMALAEAKLNQVVNDQTWSNGSNSGSFDDSPGYTWQLQSAAWTPTAELGQTSSASADVNLEQLDVTVKWTWRNYDESCTLSTLVTPTN